MVDPQLRHWSKLRYLDPVPTLRALRDLELRLAQADVSPKISRLRTAKLKPEREARDAALFSLGMSTRLGMPVLFAPVEESNYDFVTRMDVGDTSYFTPVQLKELVPAELNPAASIDKLLASLRNKRGYEDTVLALRLNREQKGVTFKAEQFDGLPFREVWLFWSASPDARKWKLLGNALETPLLSEFDYPR